MKRCIIRMATVAAVAAAVVVAVFHRKKADRQDASSDGDAEVCAPAVVPCPENRRITSRRPAHARTKAVLAVRQKPVLDLGDEDDCRTPEEKALAARIEKAFDDENLEATLACAGEAQKCGVAEIRRAMVDALGWFGAKALPELVPFLADPDEDARENARSEVSRAISDVEDDADRIGIVESVMAVMDDEDFLDDMSGEYIGIDEKLAVESLARIISGGGSVEGVKKAKETYEFVTGDEWAGEKEARRWIAEEYEPPEETVE